jgi:hypothetical protein
MVETGCRRGAEVCEVSKVFIWIPLRVVRKCYHKKTYLTFKEGRVLETKLREIEAKINYLQHVHSIVEKCLLKRSDK